jgi:putative transposase
MYKLNAKKTRWVVRAIRKGELSVEQIAKQQKITPQWARKLAVKYKDVTIKEIQLKVSGRKPKPISLKEVQTVRIAKENYAHGAILLEKVLAENGVKMSHNRIHRIMIREGLAKKEPKKSRKRKWVRWERRHSNMMWHTDYTESDYGTQIILYEDDASRYVVGHGEFPNATTDNAILVFDKAAAKWGPPDELLTDHGTQFCEDDNKEYRFRKHIESYGVKHVLARVKHPQTNGKQEKLGGTIKKIMRDRQCGLDEAVAYYNEVRPHMSLDRGHLRTPFIAYYEKMRPRMRHGNAYAAGLAYAKGVGSTARLGLELKRRGLVK